MNPTRFQLIEKLRQSKLTAALTRSKSITASSAEMPVCSAILAEAKRLGLSADEVAQQFVAGKIHLPEVDMLVGKKSIATATAKPHGLAIAATSAKPATATPAPKAGTVQAAWNAGLAKAKPTRQTAYDTFAKIKAIDPIAAASFLNINRAAVIGSAPAGVVIPS